MFLGFYNCRGSCTFAINTKKPFEWPYLVKLDSDQSFDFSNRTSLICFCNLGRFGNGSGDAGPNEPIGIINGEEIPLENFRLLVDQTERTYGYTTLQAVDVVWNQYLRNELFQTEFDILGIDAGKDQIEQVVSSTESIITDSRFINEAGFFDFGLFADFIAQMRDTNPQAMKLGNVKRRTSSLLHVSPFILT